MRKNLHLPRRSRPVLITPVLDIVINSAGEPLRAHNGARLEFYTNEEVLPLLMPGECVQRVQGRGDARGRGAARGR